MTRAALLPAGADPFLIAYWLRNYETWAEHVDELRITVSGALEPEALDYVKACVAAAPNATMDHIPHRTDHGAALAALVKASDAEYVMLCEDDAFVRAPEVIDECFRFAEAGGIVATPRDSYASTELTSAASAAFGTGYSYWPCFVFVAREHLLATDLQLGGTLWKPGDTILGHTLRGQSVADTFVWASYQLRKLGLREDIRDNYRMSGQTIPGFAPWIHVGSLSSGYGWAYMGDMPAEQYEAEVANYRLLPAGNAVQRVAWWQRAWETAGDAIPEYHARYGEALAGFRDDIGLSAADVDAYNRSIESVVTWAER